MVLLFSAILYFSASGLFAAPLSGYAMVPASTASTEERSQAFEEARQKVIAAAIKYENTPYAYGGITSRGLDCSGLIYLSFKDALGISLPRSSSGQYTWTERTPLDKAQTGDLLFFRTDASGRISHVGLYLGNGYFIHSASAGPRTGVIYSSVNESYWKRTFATAGRAFPEAAPGFQPVLADSSFPAGSWGGGTPSSPSAARPSSTASKGKIYVGAAAAPSWGGLLKDSSIFRLNSFCHL